MANPTRNLNKNTKGSRNNTPNERPDLVEGKVNIEEEVEMGATTEEEVKEPTFQFIHANKAKYIPPKYINKPGFQFVGGKFNTDDVEVARYISGFHGVICIAGEDYL